MAYHWNCFIKMYSLRKKSIFEMNSEIFFLFWLKTANVIVMKIFEEVRYGQLFYGRYYLVCRNIDSQAVVEVNIIENLL